jgi:UDPglucose 6-dehydrogenase
MVGSALKIQMNQSEKPLRSYSRKIGMPKLNMTATVYIKGLWHQGLVAAGVWSKMGFSVLGICDSNEEAIRLEKGELPIFEPGLKNLILTGIQTGNIKFQAFSAELLPPDYLVIMHDTEVDENDIVNTKVILNDFSRLFSLIRPETEILITAQIPAGTCHLISELIKEKLSISPNLSYMPENLRLGQGIDRFEKPRLPVIGISNPDSRYKLAKLFAESTKLHFCEVIEAEILKSTLNGFLALSIVYGNEISNICDSLNVNGMRVMKLLQLEKRIGTNIPILPGLPFAGGTLGRDVQNLRRLTDIKDGVIQGIWNSNYSRKEYFIRYIEEIVVLNATKNVGLIGLTYKTGTSTLRRSFAIEVANRLRENGLEIHGFDPMSARFDAIVPDSVVLQDSLKKLITNTSILVIMTPWEQIITELRTLDLQNHLLIDPFGIFVNETSRFKSYFHFGGGKFPL